MKLLRLKIYITNQVLIQIVKIPKSIDNCILLFIP